MKKFKVGDEVSWTSQSQGKMVEKFGRIVHVVPADTVPSRRYLARYNLLEFSSKVNFDEVNRDHDAYIVFAEFTNSSGRKRKGLYCPRVSHLQKVRS